MEAVFRPDFSRTGNGEVPTLSCHRIAKERTPYPKGNASENPEIQLEYTGKIIVSDRKLSNMDFFRI
jgi:hypothetical protein